MSLLFNTLISFFHSFSFKGQVSFSFMAAVTICSDFEAQVKSVTVSIISPSICHEVMGQMPSGPGFVGRKFNFACFDPL